MKRALIVDDSRSARVILSRMLEGYGLAIDSCESAEQALEFLQQARPDVIFMDHLMPGMDGFQAIQAIKNNPATATIPVMMYTSQEGELYLSQARALGAVGVLPKTVKQADVSRVLYQLHLLPERRELQATVAVPGTEAARRTEQRDAHAADKAIPAVEVAAAVGSAPAAPVAKIEAAIRAALAPVLKEHAAEMRRLVLANFEAFARRLSADVKPADAAPEPEPSAQAPQPHGRQWPLAAALAALALLPTIALAVFYTRTLDASNALLQSNATLAAAIEEQQLQLAALRQSIETRAPTLASTNAAPSGAVVEFATVPYGEAPLAGARLERLRQMIDNLTAGGFRGRLRIATYVGEFCLTGNGVEGYSIAADDLPVRRCDIFGNPFDDSLSASQRQSLAFANLLSSVRQEAAGSLTIEVEHEGRSPVVPYPEGEALAQLTASEWNRIAARNNRVEFAAEPAGS